jgi:HSP20 family molecular chaperone IbpA
MCEIKSKSEIPVDHLFVAPDEIHAHMRRALDLIEQRAYEIYSDHGRVVGHAMDDWVQAESELLQPVNAEASDGGDAFVAVAAVPGYRPEDLRVSVEPRCLTICGLTTGDRRPGSSENEPRSARFFLSFKLPADVKTSAASADIRSDVLEVRLPKVLP